MKRNLTSNEFLREKWTSKAKKNMKYKGKGQINGSRLCFYRREDTRKLQDVR